MLLAPSEVRAMRSRVGVQAKAAALAAAAALAGVAGASVYSLSPAPESAAEADQFLSTAAQTGMK